MLLLVIFTHNVPVVLFHKEVVFLHFPWHHLYHNLLITWILWDNKVFYISRSKVLKFSTSKLTQNINAQLLYFNFINKLCRYKLTVLKNNCINQDYPDWVNLRTWFLFLYQNVQHEKTEKIKAESGQMTEWNALEPENDSIWRTAIAPWFSSLESSIQHRLKRSSRVKLRSKVITFDSQWSAVWPDTFSCSGLPFFRNQLVFCN